jgi:rubrerythrin
MSLRDLSPHLIATIEKVIDQDYRAMGMLAEIADEIRDPTLRAIVFGIIGDENGHVRFFRSLLSQATNSSTRHCCRKCGNRRNNFIVNRYCRTY